jgi:hypothetical protein
VSAGASELATALALTTVAGPLAGIVPAVIVERGDGGARSLRCCWALQGGGCSVSIEARAPTLDACHARIAQTIYRLWPELEAVAQ